MLTKDDLCLWGERERYYGKGAPSVMHSHVGPPMPLECDDKEGNDGGSKRFLPKSRSSPTLTVGVL